MNNIKLFNEHRMNTSYIREYDSYLIMEAIIMLDYDIKEKLNKLKTIVNDKQIKGWTDEILNNVEKEIDNINLKDNSYTVRHKDDKYMNIESDKGQKTDMKMGKTLKLLAPNIPDHVLSTIVSGIKSQMVNHKVVILKGYEILEGYSCSSIKSSGTLGNSCMLNMEESFFSLYTENPDSIKMATIYDDYDDIITRVLLFKNIDNNWISTTIYYTEDYLKNFMENWLIENGYIIHGGVNDKYDETQIPLDEVDFNYYPFLDDFKYLCINKKLLSNKDIFDNDDSVIELNESNGKYNVVRNVKAFNHIETLDVTETNSVGDFLNLCIDIEKFKEDLIDEQVAEYLDYKEDFINVFSYTIKDYLELLEEVIERPVEEDEDPNEIILKLNYHKFEKYITLIFTDLNEYKDFEEYIDDLYGSEEFDKPFNDLNKDMQNYVIKIVDEYGSVDLMNDELDKINDNEYIQYILGYY